MTIAYLATPYSKYRLGLDQAFRDAARLVGALIVKNVSVYSPIVHQHPVAAEFGLDPLDHAFWLAEDEAMMARMDALIVAHMEGWDESAGIAHEVRVFEAAGKPIFDLDPVTLKMARRKGTPAPDYGQPDMLGR